MDDHLGISDHAVDRYIERVKPTLTRREATKDLRRLARSVGTITAERPEWVGESCYVDGWLLLGDDIALPVLKTPGGWLAKTVLARGVLPPGVRRMRNRAKAARRRWRGFKPRSERRREGIEEEAVA